ncbi:hypothetical protein [Bacillus massiliglaciei]|nr:hypothetical protein [Bacillus massiliglaciei]
MDKQAQQHFFLLLQSVYERVKQEENLSMEALLSQIKGELSHLFKEAK